MNDILIGLQIKLARTIDVPCAECGETAVTICSGADPHMAALRCVCCQRYRGNLPKAVADFLVTAIDKFGRPTAPITIRDSLLAAPVRVQSRSRHPVSPGRKIDG